MMFEGRANMLDEFVQSSYFYTFINEIIKPNNYAKKTTLKSLFV
jgi:hypothetical protein